MEEAINIMDYPYIDRVLANIPTYPKSISPSRLAEISNISSALCSSVVTALTYLEQELCEDDNGRLSIVR